MKRYYLASIVGKAAYYFVEIWGHEKNLENTSRGQLFSTFLEAFLNNRRVLWQYKLYNTKLYKIDWPRAKQTYNSIKQGFRINH